MGQGMDGMNESWEPEDNEDNQRQRRNSLVPEPERLRIEAAGLFRRAQKAEEKNKALTAERDRWKEAYAELYAGQDKVRRLWVAEKLIEMADGGLNWDAVTLRREAEVVLTEGK